MALDEFSDTSLDRLASASFSIADIVALAGDGTIRVPTFQRQFVWNAKDVRDLFDSLYRGFPVGTLLLWWHKSPATTVQLGPITLTVPDSSDVLWVVDGQQRITSLFASLSPDHSGVDERFEVYFDLATEKFVNPRGGAIPPRSIPVREALETRSLLNWLRRHGDELESTDLDLADRLGGTLRDYRIPAYIVSGNNQELLRKVFDRVNSAGKPISRAQVFHALFARDEQPGSPSSVVAELGPLNFGKIDENRIVQSLLGIRGGDVQRDIHDEFGNDEDPADWYDRTEQALVRSITFLRAQGVPHLLLMPNTLPLPVLATFFHIHTEPEPWTLRLLSRWLWRGWVHGFGWEAGQTPVLRRAIRSINPRHRNPAEAPPEYEAVRSLLEYTPDREASELRLDGFKTNSANSRLILLAMASLAPKRADGRLVDLVMEMENRGVDAITEFVRGHRTEAAARGFWPVDAGVDVAEVEDDDVLRSHAIDSVAMMRLQAGDIDGFLRHRGERLRQLVSEFLGSRLEQDALVRPSLRSLALAGAAEEDS